MPRTLGDMSTLSRDVPTTDIRGALLLAVGAGLVLLGAALLVAVGLLVLDIITDPGSVKIVALFLDQTPSASSALSGDIAGSRFSIAIDEPLRTLLFLVVGVWIIGALASILKVVTLTGKELLLAGRRPPPGGDAS